jgi:DNA-binding CsgD family transcriptional regulator
MEALMEKRGRPKAPLVLSKEERDTLARWARRPNSPQALALRSKIVLACAEDKTNQAVAAELSCSQATVGKWRSLCHKTPERPRRRVPARGAS